MARKVELSPPQFKPLRFDKRSVRRLIQWLDRQPEYCVSEGELSLSFLDDSALAKVHADFLSDPSPTDVITFPGDVTEGFAGEILVSAERAASEAYKHGNSFTEELSLYMIHGWLHLAGLDDIEETDRQAMREAEALLMRRMREEGTTPNFYYIRD